MALGVSLRPILKIKASTSDAVLQQVILTKTVTNCFDVASVAAIDLPLHFIKGLPPRTPITAIEEQGREQKVDVTLAVTSKCTEVCGNVTSHRL